MSVYVTVYTGLKIEGNLGKERGSKSVGRSRQFIDGWGKLGNLLGFFNRVLKKTKL